MKSRNRRFRKGETVSPLKGVEDLERLADCLLRLMDAENTAIQAYPEALSEIRALLDNTVEEILRKAPTVFNRLLETS